MAEPALDRVERLLDEATLWGLELEPRYRVLAGTFEVSAGAHPEPGASDRRVQVLMHPVHTILAVLQPLEEQAPVEVFDVAQLLDVVEALGGPVVRAPLFGRGEPAWGPAWSLEGRARTHDGRRHDVTLDVTGSGRRLRLYATFDELEVRGPDGRPIALAPPTG